MNQKRYAILLVNLSLIFAVVQAAADGPESAGPSARSDTNIEAPDSRNSSVRRTRVTRDPATGKTLVAPAPGIPVHTLSAREQNMLSRSDEGLQSTVLANGAVAVDLRGRFQSMVTASSDSGGNQLKTSCRVGDDAYSSAKLAGEAR
jgi:hypothetical protein